MQERETIVLAPLKLQSVAVFSTELEPQTAFVSFRLQGNSFYFTSYWLVSYLTSETELVSNFHTKTADRET